MPVLYFPEDKTEYIPAAFSLVIFGLLFLLTFRWIRRVSKRQEEETRELEERILSERREAKENEHLHN